MPVDHDGRVSDLSPRRIEGEGSEQCGGLPPVHLVGGEPSTGGVGGQPAGGGGLGGRVVGNRAGAGFEPAGERGCGQADVDRMVTV
jgi:hypothetical protein